MILITGATGHLGEAVISQLLNKMPASQIAALARDEQKAATLRAQGIDIRIGDYDSTALLNDAMKDIEHVLLISGGDAANSLEQHQNVVNAAKKAGVQGIAYTSRSLKDRNSLANTLMERHFHTEDYIKASGLKYILFRNALYMDTIPRFVGEQVFDTGISLPAGDGKVAFALRKEMGEAMANVLASGKFNDRTYSFTGSHSWTFQDVAGALSQLSGKSVPYTSITDEKFEERLSAQGLPPVMTQRITAFVKDIRNGQEAIITNEMAEVLGRTPASLLEGLPSLYPSL